MKRVLLAILTVLMTTAAFADAGDRGRNDRHNDNRNDNRNDRYDRHDDRHDNHGGRPNYPPNHGGYYPAPRPPVFIPVPVQPAYYPQSRIVHCSSYSSTYCFTGMRSVSRIDIIRQNGYCTPGLTAILQGNSIYVANGCEADFNVVGIY